jgi:predicted small metal-binding protein
MARELHCRDLGFDCEGVVVAENDDEVVAQAAQHARDVHGMTDEQLGDPAFANQVRSQIHEQADSA